MKILKVKGKNLASLGGEFEIDFTAEPLASAGIFAITGNTGSGKSTILDAICLALYDSTPRMNKAKEANVLLKDVSDKAISQNDSRSILRRGTADGYSQVEFVASTGEKYRATWSVRRAGNKPTGALQKVEMNALNIDTGEPLQGTKTEIQTRLVQLIGLSFEQFSRSVLLAQGDFASFLKAKKDEKAEILEKLTGTEIYSQISSSIYAKAKDIETKKKELLQHIQNVEILSDEEKETLGKERDEKKSILETVNKQEVEYRHSIKWIDDYKMLLDSIAEANDNIALLKKEIDEASPRYEKVTVIDSAQAVRNIYVQHTLSKKQITEGENSLVKENENLIVSEKELAKAIDIKEKATVEINDYNKYIEEIQPSLELARKLDVQIEEKRKHRADIEEDNKKLEVLLQKTTNQHNDESSKLEAIKQEIDKLSKWFEHYQGYSSLIPAKELVTNLLSNYYDSKEQINSFKKTKQDVNKNIEIYENSQKLAQQEAQRLNNLQPSEVIIIRKKLEEGKPCPVCGSIHHPFVSEKEDNSVKEEELEKQKDKAAKEIERITLLLENSQRELIRINSSLDNYEKQKNTSFGKVEKYVSILPNWNELLDNGKLKEAVIKFVNLWDTNTSSLNLNKEKLSATQASIEALLREVNNEKAQIDEKKKIFDDVDSSLKQLTEQRNSLLNGKSCDEAQKEISDKKGELDKRVEEAKTLENSLKIGAESGKTKIKQIETQIKKDKDIAQSAKSKIEEWFLSQEKIKSFDELDDIFSKDEQWLADEKKYLSSLNEKYAASKAVMIEREKKRKEHAASFERPSDNESRESIQEKLDAVVLEKDKINMLLAQISVRLENDEKNRKKVEAYQKEYDSKNHLFQAWSNLNDLFGSQSGNKFKEIAQEYTLDILVMYANNHLKELAPRYELERIQDALALQIVDLDMMGERRSVHSLSGGESFLVSLALALGLSSISSNRMNVESLFIDEGFGSLDIETLRIAMDALECLQMQGRKIGVISHVSEMTERINARIQVTKEGSGRSIISVV